MELQIYKGMWSMQCEKNSTVIYTESALVVVAERNTVNKPVGNTIKLQPPCSMQMNLLRPNFLGEFVPWNLRISWGTWFSIVVGIQQQSRMYSTNYFIAKIILIFCNSFIAGIVCKTIGANMSPYNYTSINNWFYCIDKINSFWQYPLPHCSLCATARHLGCLRAKVSFCLKMCLCPIYSGNRNC